jgi:hypothetical protein
MEFDIEKMHTIDLYLKGRLNEVAKGEFEAKLESDIYLMQIFEKQKLANELIVENHILNIKHIARTVVETKRKSWGWLSGIFWGITVVGIASFSYLYFQNKNTTTSLVIPVIKENSTVAKSESSIGKIENSRVLAKIIKPKPDVVNTSLNDTINKKDELDKLAQYAFLKHLDKQMESPKIGVHLQPVQKELSNGKKHLDNDTLKLVSTFVENEAIMLPVNFEYIFELVFNQNTDEYLVLPINIENGSFKIIDNDGRALFESRFGDSEKPIIKSNMFFAFKSNTELNVLVSDNQNKTVGVGKVTILK